MSEVPQLRTEGDDIYFDWGDLALSVVLRNIGGGRDGVRAEVAVRHKEAGHYHQANLSLMSTSGRTTFAKMLATRDPSLDWSEIVEQFCVMASEQLRRGEPLELLEPKRKETSGRFLLNPLIPRGQTTLWFGDGGSGKSLLALAACRAIALEQDLGAMHTSGATVAFLDWEWDKDEHEDRLLRLGGDITIFYRHCTAPFADQAKMIKRDLDRERVDFVVIDSLGLACGGDLKEAEIVLKFFSALRGLNRQSSLVIHHVPKDKRDPYGSAYVKNSARSAWYVVRSSVDEKDGFRIVFQHRKVNAGPLLGSYGMRIAFDEEAYTTTVGAASARVPELVSGVKDRILMVLDEYDGMTYQSLANELEMAEEKIRDHLSKLKKQGKAYNDDNHLWFLVPSGGRL